MRKIQLFYKAELALDDAPSDSDMALINAGPVLKKLSADDVMCRSCLAINTLRMEQGIVMPEDEVRAIAGKSVGAPIQRNHDTYTGEGLPVGRVFAAIASKNGDVMECRQRFYMIKADPLSVSLGARIDGGVIQEVSCSFAYDKMECSIDGGDLWDCNHMPNEEYDGQQCTGIVRGVGDYYETSLVWKGAATGTRLALMFGADFLEHKQKRADWNYAREIMIGDWFEGREAALGDLFLK